MIEVRNVTKTYRLGAVEPGESTARRERVVEALRGASLALERPGFFAIMGPSGSGKSTLLHLLAGLDRPDAGEIVVDGQAVHRLGEADLTRYRRLRIGVVFQQFNLIPTMTALENVSLPGLLDGRSEKWLRERATGLLASLGLGERLRHRPDALSGGEQQRVAIARALLFEPKVLFADEPTGNLDSASSQKIWRMLADLARDRGLTVLMVTHEPAGAAHCDRVFVLADGRVIESIEVEEHDAAWMAARYQRAMPASAAAG